MVDRLASCFVDRRSQAHVEHSVATLVGQRIFAMASLATRISMTMRSCATIR
jgi:hypothetical protein